MSHEADNLDELGKRLVKAVTDAFDRSVTMQAKELGITREEVMKRLAVELDQQAEELRKHCTLEDPT